MERTTQLLRNLGWTVVGIHNDCIVLDVLARDIVRRTRCLIDALQDRGCMIWPCRNTHGLPCMWIEFDPVARDCRLYLVINDEVLFGSKPSKDQQEENS